MQIVQPQAPSTSMGLLDFDDTYRPPFKPRKLEREPTEEERQTLLSNHDREVEPEDYSNSPHLNY